MSIHHDKRSVLLLPQAVEDQMIDAFMSDGIRAASLALKWDHLRLVQPDRLRLRENQIVTLNRSHPASVPFDVLRTKLLRLARENGWMTIGVTSPTPRSGTTTVTLNLALSLSHQPDHRTLLLDLNLRSPGLAGLLGLDAITSDVDLFGDEGQPRATVVRCGETLAVAAVTKPVPMPAEVLQAKATARRLGEIRRDLEPCIVLVDAPPMLQRDDFEATLALYDAVLLVADAERTLVADLDRCERDLSEHTKVIGVVINRCRFAR